MTTQIKKPPAAFIAMRSLAAVRRSISIVVPSLDDSFLLSRVGIDAISMQCSSSADFAVLRQVDTAGAYLATNGELHDVYPVPSVSRFWSAGSSVTLRGRLGGRSRRRLTRGRVVKGFDQACGTLRDENYEYDGLAWIPEGVRKGRKLKATCDRIRLLWGPQNTYLIAKPHANACYRPAIELSLAGFSLFVTLST